jgi:predicted N-acetyltransferase YhbS
MKITIRHEIPDDYYAVESLTRDAFWGNTDSRDYADEHLLVHRLRTNAAFVPELDYVAEVDGNLAGNVMYSKAKIVAEDGLETEVLTFGPLSVAPEYKLCGVGSALMKHSIAEAKRLGYRAIVFFGHPDYYPRFGFKRGAEYGITAPDGSSFDALMAMELYDGALGGISGKFIEDPVFETMTQEDAEAFDKNFPPKALLPKAYIDELLPLLSPAAQETVKALGMKYLVELRGITERDMSSRPGMDAEALDTIRKVMKQHGRVWGERKTTDPQH